MSEFNIGSRIKHPKFGEGIITGTDLYNLRIFFRDGDRDISRDYEGLEILEEVETGSDRLTLEDVEAVLTGVLQKFADITLPVQLGDRWRGGSMILQPAKPDQKPKEIPVETFFNKIVMMRDRLRVLEAQINSNDKLSSEEKVNLQQYITRCYGSMTTFNILFKEKDEYFKGEGGKS